MEAHLLLNVPNVGRDVVTNVQKSCVLLKLWVEVRVRDLRVGD